MAIVSINGEVLTNLSKGLRAVFNKALQDVKVEYELIATVIDSTDITEDYSWLGDMPEMREWIGDRVVKDLSSFGYSITKKDFELTIGVDRDNIKYDKLGIVKIRVQALAPKAKRKYDQLVFGLVEANGTCYDGKTFFATDHPMGTGTFSNLGGLPLTRENFLATRAEMKKLKSDTEQPLLIEPNLLMVPPDLESTAIEILKNDRVATGGTNTTYNMADYIVNPYLTSSTGWGLFDTTGIIKPFILQKVGDIDFVAKDKPTDDNVFMQKKFLYGVDGEFNAGYGLPQLGYWNDGTGT